jgi:hypothetical protein
MSRFRSSGNILTPKPDSIATGGPKITGGLQNPYSGKMYSSSDTIEFRGNFQARYGHVVAATPWGGSMDDATVLIHELSHTSTGGLSRSCIQILEIRFSKSCIATTG